MQEIISEGNLKTTENFEFEFKDGELIIILPDKTKYKLSPKNTTFQHQYLDSPSEQVFVYRNEELEVKFNLIESNNSNSKKNNSSRWSFLFKEDHIMIILPGSTNSKYSFIPMNEDGELEFIGKEGDIYEYKNKDGHKFNLELKRMD